MIEGGYILQPRCFGDSEIATCPPHFREIWFWLLREANHKDVKWHGKTIKRGQCIRSYADIQEGLHWMVGWRKETYSKNQCETAMRWLKKHTMITTQKLTRGLLITIVNYDKYQDSDNYKNDTKHTTKHTRNIQSVDTINKNEIMKKERELKKLLTHFNQITNSSYKSLTGYLDYYNILREEYSYQEIHDAISNVNKLDHLKSKQPDPGYVLNPKNGFIDKLLNIKSKSNGRPKYLY